MDPLTEIGNKHGTDKVSHNFTQVYELAFRELRDRPLNILEIGIWKGESLRTFKEYFPNAQIYAFDIEDKSQYKEERIHISQGDQSNIEYIKSVFSDISFDIIIDDGSHCMNHQQISFEYLLPRVKAGGIYILEDLHTSTNAWPHLGGGDNKPDTTLKFLRDLKQDTVSENHSYYINDVKALAKQIKNITVYATNSTDSITSIIEKNDIKNER